MRYAGIGPRATPQYVLDAITEGARDLSLRGHHLVSGHGAGADQAWEQGAALNMQTVYVPYECFNNARRYGAFRVVEFTEPMLALAEKHHPAWNKCSDYIRKLMARNVAILFGPALDEPVDFVLYWQGWNVHKYTGGTGHSLRMADAYGIPNFNIRSEADAFNDFLLTKEKL